MKPTCVAFERVSEARPLGRARATWTYSMKPTDITFERVPEARPLRRLAPHGLHSMKPTYVAFERVSEARPLGRARAHAAEPSLTVGLLTARSSAPSKCPNLRYVVPPFRRNRAIQTSSNVTIPPKRRYNIPIAFSAA